MTGESSEAEQWMKATRSTGLYVNNQKSITQRII